MKAMKLKRLLRALGTIIVIYALVFGILPILILPKLDIGEECGGWAATSPISGTDCTCIGIKYNYNPEMIGVRQYKCLGYCPTNSCKEF